MLRAPTQIDRILTLVVLGVLFAGCYFVLAPFLTAIRWAAILCDTTWPLFVQLRLRLGNRPSIAAFVMMLVSSTWAGARDVLQEDAGCIRPAA